MKAKVLRIACMLFLIGAIVSLMSHPHSFHSGHELASALLGGSGFWAGLACGASIGALVFAAPTGVLLAAGIVVAVGTCGDAFFG
jgi:hypothetical protein